MKSLYALLMPESLSLLKEMFRQAPFSTLDTPALYIGASSGELEVRTETGLLYVAKPTQFFLGKNPFTGNTSLILNLDMVGGIEQEVPGTLALAQRAAELDESSISPCIFVSDGIHEIPRHYRNFLNSLENSFARERYDFMFHAEFVVEL